MDRLPWSGNSLGVARSRCPQPASFATLAGGVRATCAMVGIISIPLGTGGMFDMNSLPTDSCLDTLRTAFRDDGVLCVRSALDARAMRLAHQAFQWSLEHPGPGARDVLAGRPGAFYQDHAHPDAFAAYRELLTSTALVDLIARIMRSQGLWLLYEQIWFKGGGPGDAGHSLPTPWHQDLPYVPMQGDHLATAWFNLDPVARQQSLEFVPGSHRGPLFNPTAFDPWDRAAAMYADEAWPCLPDIDAQRDAWSIVSWHIEPGDIVVFHPAILHGGAPTCAGTRRRTISLRFFGDQAFCAARPEGGVAEVDRLSCGDEKVDPMVAMARQPAGTLFRHPLFARLR